MELWDFSTNENSMCLISAAMMSSVRQWVEFKIFYPRKWPNTSQNFCYSHSLNFHISGSTESVSKQPTQLIIAAKIRHIT